MSFFGLDPLLLGNCPIHDTDQPKLEHSFEHMSGFEHHKLLWICEKIVIHNITPYFMRKICTQKLMLTYS